MLHPELLTESELAALRADLNHSEIPPAAQGDGPEPTPELKAAWLNYHAVDSAELPELKRFYNRYYWFMRYSRLYQAQYGPDAGLEQQGFKMIEAADSLDPDWSVVEVLDSAAADI